MTDESSSDPQKDPQAADAHPTLPPADAQETVPAAEPDAAASAPATSSAAAGADPDDHESRGRFKIQIGSRKGDKGQQITASQPQIVAPPPPAPVGDHAELASAPVPPPPPSAPVQPPSKRAPLSADLEQEMQAALGDLSIDRLVDEESTKSANQEIETDTRHQANIARIHGDNVFFSLGGRNEGVVSIRQFRQPPSIGDKTDVVVKSYNVDDGLYELQLAGSATEVSDWSDVTDGTVVEARITGANTGGLECMLGSIRGFIPASQIGLFRVEDFAEYIGQKLPCVVTESNRKRRNLVLSHRAYLEREREESRKQLLEQLEAGQTVDGVVRNLRDFGAFVDLGGIDGLIHVSQISWDRIGHPREVLEEGQKVRVRIEKINKQTGKISLTYRDLMEHPWANAEATFSVGSTVKGPVSRVAKFGAFVRLAPGIEGLIHISELAHRRIRQVTDVVNEGDEVEAKVLSVDAKTQRMALSLRAAQPEPEQGEPEQAADEPSRELSVSRRRSPLKGGFDRPSGGEDVGLKW